MSVDIFFSDFFDVPIEAIAEFGTVDISLVNDIPLFIDPFLLFNSDRDDYRQLHEEIIRYVQFLRDKSISRQLEDGLLRNLYCFPEVKQLWLGFCLSGNEGSGLGLDFAHKLNRNLRTIFTDFGSEPVTAGSHIEKLCLVETGVGKDNISDFCANLIKKYLVDFTVAFSDRFLAPELRSDHYVERVFFNYDTESWVSSRYSLPTFNGDYVLLAPRDMLTKDETWINRSDLIGRFDDVQNTIENEVLRAKINNYFMKRLPQENVSDKDIREATVATIRKFPEFIEYFIRYKENNGRFRISCG